ncbi:GNAT family N-acetyltransferase [Kosmotoga pacifica]|uniref:N-acetyltransferase domain-containing protein n=1 Tax=Kosmotoga pacifica TaxID=1330330 RepID=A0A0G2ZE31_9BACT|nr:GNAT family N-acetyltransferase [Kosmotoga pacifica]AKI97068.1 hypothetical protein IX53_03655 [Kosmotoga pacifica]
MSEKLFIRPAREDEYEFIRHNMYESIPESSGYLYKRADLREKDVVYGDFYDSIRRGDRIIIAELSGKVLGYSHYGVSSESNVFCSGRHGHLFDLYVFPQYRRKGIASQLLFEAEEWLKNLGIDHLTAVTSKNTSAWSFLVSKGFVTVRSYLKLDIEDFIPIENVMDTCTVSRDELFVFSEPLSMELKLNEHRFSECSLSELMYALGKILNEGANLVVVGGERPIGFAIYSIFDDILTRKRLGFIEFLYILPEFRKHGAGKALLSHICRTMRGDLVEEVYTEAPIKGAYFEFLKKFGFEGFSFWLQKDFNRPEHSFQ